MRFKILVFVLALAFLAGTFLAAYWFYDTIDRPEQQAERPERRAREVATLPPPDPPPPPSKRPWRPGRR
jgi:peptidoglycan/LPS O-acetylase OafA/YrhL